MSWPEDVDAKGESNGSLEGYRREQLEQEMLRLRQQVIHTMDYLAGQVLDQIQTTRGLADATEALLIQLKGAGAAGDPQAQGETRLRRLSWEIEGAMRELPEQLWDRYTQSCKELARLLQGLSITDPTPGDNPLEPD